MRVSRHDVHKIGEADPEDVVKSEVFGAGFFVHGKEGFDLGRCGGRYVRGGRWERRGRWEITLAEFVARDAPERHTLAGGERAFCPCGVWNPVSFTNIYVDSRR